MFKPGEIVRLVRQEITGLVMHQERDQVSVLWPNGVTTTLGAHWLVSAC